MFVAEYRDHSQNDREPPVMRPADAMFSSYRARRPLSWCGPYPIRGTHTPLSFLANQLSHTPA